MDNPNPFDLTARVAKWRERLQNPLEHYGDVRAQLANLDHHNAPEHLHKLMEDLDAMTLSFFLSARSKDPAAHRRTEAMLLVLAMLESISLFRETATKMSGA